MIVATGAGSPLILTTTHAAPPPATKATIKSAMRNTCFILPVGTEAYSPRTIHWVCGNTTSPAMAMATP